MRKFTYIWAGLAVFGLAVTAAVAQTYTIPADKLDSQQVYWGNAESFEKPGAVNYQQVVMATPEYEEIRNKRVKSGTAKYWILLSDASNHAVRVISEVGNETDYDLIAAKGYLSSLDPPIPADDITGAVLDKLDGE